MTGKNTAVFGIYSDRASVESAVDALKAAGYRNTDISLMSPENVGTKDFAHEKATKAPEGATAGAGSGAVIGGTLGWLIGIGAVAIPGVGPLIAAGPIVAALAGAGAGGVVGGLTGALIGMGIPEYEAKRYEGRVRNGGILLSVHSDDSDWTKRAKEILERTGAKDIASVGESSADFAKADRPMPRSTGMSEYDTDYRRHFLTRYRAPEINTSSMYRRTNSERLPRRICIMRVVTGRPSSRSFAATGRLAEMAHGRISGNPSATAGREGAVKKLR